VTYVLIIVLGHYGGRMVFTQEFSSEGVCLANGRQIIGAIGNNDDRSIKWWCAPK
jgi:hypothetical protein